MDTIIKALIAHGHANYNKGWDYLIECYSEAEIAEELQEEGISTLDAAIKHFGESFRLRSEIQAEHDAEARDGGGGYEYELDEFEF